MPKPYAKTIRQNHAPKPCAKTMRRKRQNHNPQAPYIILSIRYFNRNTLPDIPLATGITIPNAKHHEQTAIPAMP
jgi:hypothetical protein